ncbi:4Fe-4S binding protein [Vulcanisaeta sp. JCM 16161]|uniref:4Fe-4S binding protein n=1 Tax=Vulcanisaeta sp. JCM 16161 TaxID=1295372 RepID=UPI00406C99C3
MSSGAWAPKAVKLLGWRELPAIGGYVIEPMSTAKNNTGSWRTERPVIDQDACIRCRTCWVYCPEPAILELDKPYVTKDGRRYDITYEIDYDHCKGCGICAHECPTKAIRMVPEGVEE